MNLSASRQTFGFAFVSILFLFASIAQAQPNNPNHPGEPARLLGYEFVEASKTVTGLADRSQVFISVVCPEDKVVTGGSCSSTITPAHLFSSYATNRGGLSYGIEGWHCRWANWSGLNVTATFSVNVVAFCINAP